MIVDKYMIENVTIVTSTLGNISCMYTGRHFWHVYTVEASSDIIQMTHDGECDMLKYIVPKLKCQHDGKARVLTFQLRDYIFACHKSPSCVICFVAPVTKLRLKSNKNLHFTGTERYSNYVTT